MFLFSLVLAQHNSSGVTFTRHDATPRRNSARQKQGVCGAMKHPSPAVGHMCKEKGEKRSLVVLLHLKLIWVFLKCSLNKQDRAAMLYTQKTRIFFFIILLSCFFSLLLSISLNKRSFKWKPNFAPQEEMGYSQRN